jgi:regulation of enolase protein 1 (concanavalin A-like superfamily)
MGRKPSSQAFTTAAIVFSTVFICWGIRFPITLQAQPPQEHRSALHGNVEVHCVDSDGNAVVGAEIHLFQHSGGEVGRYLHRGPAKTDSNGRANGGLAVFTDQENSTFDRWVYARIPNQSVGIARSFRWKNRQAINSEFKVVMQPSRTVEGRVVVPDGFDPRRVTVRVLSLQVITGNGPEDFESLPRYEGFAGLDTALREIFECRPNAEGQIRFNDVPNHGQLYLATKGPGLGEVQWRNGNNAFELPIHLTVEKESILTGTVISPSEEPIPGAEIYARLSGRRNAQVVFESTFRAITNEKGEFAIHGLPKGAVTLYVTDPQKRWIFRPNEKLSVRPGEVVEVKAAMEVGVQVTGRIFDPDNKPVEGVALSAVSDGEIEAGFESDLSDADGRYELLLPAGETRFCFNSLPSGFDYPDPQSERRLEIEPGHAPIEHFDFTVPRAKDWGRVIDPDGDCKIEVGESISITIPTTPHDLSFARTSGGRNAPRVLRDVEGDFVIQVKVVSEFDLGDAPSAANKAIFNGAGLLLWVDENHFIRFERNVMRSGDSKYCFAPLLEQWKNKRFVGKVSPVEDASFFEGNSTYLRLERSGNEILTSMSHNGLDWLPSKSIRVGLPRKLSIGVSAGNTSNKPFAVKFEDYKFFLRNTERANSQQ